MQKTGKQAARGQKQIHAENSSTILHYSVTSLCSSIFVGALYVWVFKSTTGFWVGWSMASLLQALSVGIMYSMVKSVKNERNQVVDAGLDLNDPQAFGEYCKDLVILCTLINLLSLVWSYFYWGLLAVPAFALFKLWVNLLGPWFFAPPAETEETSDKKQKRRDKKVYARP